MYIKYNSEGEYGFYTPDIHGQEFCDNECMEIPEDLYKLLLDNNGRYVIDVKSVGTSITRENIIEKPHTNVIIEPTKEEKNRSDIDYLSIMTGVDLYV